MATSKIAEALTRIASAAFDAGFRSLAVRCEALAKIHATNGNSFADAVEQTAAQCVVGAKMLETIAADLRSVASLAAGKAA